jgi:hypothetical protein
MPKKSAAPGKRGAGRPKELRGDARPRTIRMTDAERAAVVRFLKELRAKSGAKNV